MGVRQTQSQTILFLIVKEMSHLKKHNDNVGIRQTQSQSILLLIVKEMSHMKKHNS